MSIKNRLILSIGLIFLSVVGMFIATWVVTASQKSDSLVINMAGRQRMLSQKLAKEALTYDFTQNQELRGKIQKTKDVFEATLNALLESGMAPTTLDPKGPKAKLPEVSGQVREQLLKANAQWTEYRKLIAEELETGHTDVDRLISESMGVLKASNGAVLLMQSESEARVSSLLITQGGCVAIGLAIVLIVLFFIRNRLTTPLGNLQRFAGNVADGDLDAQIQGVFTGELAVLKDSIEIMVGTLRENMAEAASKGEEAERSAAEAHRIMEESQEQQEQVKGLLELMSRFAAKAGRISQDVSSSVVELGARVDEVQRGTDVQRDRMAETATAMEEMNATVLEVARNASSAARSGNEARENAKTGAKGVGDAVTSIDAVRDQMFALNESMAELGEQAESIGNIMNVVSDIADQTNLLALNAAIEAARAGDAGRGFAVVADEVRKLAEKTMSATKEVGDAVLKIQQQARDNVLAVEKSVEDIVASTEAASESGRFMNEIVSIVGETAGQVESIATASEEQSAASEEINIAVTDVTRIAGETAEGMLEATRALEAMVAMTTELDAVIRDMGNASITNGKKSAAGRGEQSGKRSDRAGLKAADPTGLMQWGDDLSVNIRELDEQHVRLIDLINALHQAMRSRQGSGAVAKVLDQLKEYTVFHFATEEKLFKRHGYSDQENHMAAHRKFVDKVLYFEEQILSGKATVTMEVMNFLKDWLVKHIKGVDKRYSGHLNEKGIY